MKKIVLEDYRNSYHSSFKVRALSNTIEWKIGQYLPEKDVETILRRSGVNTVKVDIVKGEKR